MPNNLSCSFLKNLYLLDHALSVCYAGLRSLSQLSNLSTNVPKFQFVAGFLEAGSNIWGRKWQYELTIILNKTKWEGHTPPPSQISKYLLRCVCNFLLQKKLEYVFSVVWNDSFNFWRYLLHYNEFMKQTYLVFNESSNYIFVHKMIDYNIVWKQLLYFFSWQGVWRSSTVKMPAVVHTSWPVHIQLLTEPLVLKTYAFHRILNIVSIVIKLNGNILIMLEKSVVCLCD